MALRFWLGLTLAAVSAAHAQSVRWEPGYGTLALNQLSELSLVFEQCEPTGTVKPPAVPGLMFGVANRSENTALSIINGKASRTSSVTLTYRVRPTERQTLTIPAFNIDTDKGRLRVPSATFEVGDATIGQTGLSIDQVAQSRFTVPSSGSVWAGEVFPLTYTLGASKRYLYNINKDFEWDSAPLSIEPWTDPPQQVEAVLNNEQRVSIIYKTRAVAKTPGDYALHPATHLVNISTGPSSFGLFSRSNLTQLAVTTPRVDLTVKPLPSPAPADFKGAVGQFTLDSKIVPATAAVGEPITWTLTLDGTGNWPDIDGLPSRSVSKDFTPITPQAKRTNKENALFDASITEDIVLIPTKPGSYTLGPVTFSVFNPATGAYETLSTKPVTVQVTPAAIDPNQEPRQPDSAPSDPSRNGERERPEPAPTAAIPRDPLPPASSVSAPISRSTLVVGLLTSLLAPLFVWLALALRRARVTDPGRPLREAHIRLTDTIRRIAAADSNEKRQHPDADRVQQREQANAAVCAPSVGHSSLVIDHSDGPDIAPLLQAWQADTAILWRLPQAVPTPASFLPSSDRPVATNASEWSVLWAEADHTLYGAAPLPADWPTRAAQALAAHRAPSFSPFQLFLPRNLLPLLVIIASLLTIPSSFAAESERSGERERPDPTSAYAKGDFATAEKAWTATLKSQPTDWSAHHNLALALIQQNRPGEAAGHALAAFVQQPHNPSVRWHLAYTFKAAGVTPVAIKPFLADSPGASVARLASPTCWQFALIASAWLAALGLSLGIYGAYRKRPRTWLVRSLVAASVLLAMAGAWSLHTYGPLAEAHAVVVVTPTTLRSIPTDLDTPQKSSPLSLGVIATTDKAFLGWRRLVFPDGQTGWARAETLVPLWGTGR